MRNLTAYKNSLWLVDGERFERCITAAIAKPCPSAKEIRKRHKGMMKLAAALPEQAVQGSGVDDPAELGPLTVREFTNPGGNIVQLEAPRAIRAVKGKVGVIPIYGPVAQRMSGELEKAGGTPIDFVSAALDAMMANASVGAVVLRFDSPGGSVDGVQELADKIFAARAEKPIFAIADSMAASAALWLASAATMFVSTPGGGGGTVGSHGVYTMHVDESAALEQDGVKVTVVSAGKYKTEFAPYGPLSDDARQEAQSRVDGIYGNFTVSLAKFRDKAPGYVRDNFGQGRMLTAEQALSVGMIDRILSFEALMAKLTGSGSPVSSGPSAEKLLLLHEYEESEDDEA